MPAKSRKKNPEAMLLRIIRVAEILAQDEGIGSILTQYDQKAQPVASADCAKQKTQAQHFHVS